MKEMWKKYKRQTDWWGNLFDRSIGIGGYVAANQDTAVQTKVRDKTGGKVLQSEDCENEFEGYNF